MNKIQIDKQTDRGTDSTLSMQPYHIDDDFALASCSGYPNNADGQAKRERERQIKTDSQIDSQIDRLTDFQIKR